jgi:hypothetical protein
MNYKYQYTDDASRTTIVAANTDKVLIEEDNISDGNFLKFSDITEPTGVADLVTLISQGVISLDGILIDSYKTAVEAAQTAATTTST